MLAPFRSQSPVRSAMALGVLTFAACADTPTQTPGGDPADAPAGFGQADATLSPRDAAPAPFVMARSHVGGSLVFENEVDLSSAPGPDGIPGTADDLRFDDSWTGPRLYGFPSPGGDLWESLGVRFDLVDGGTAFTNSGGCFGSQRPSPFNNWSGGIRVTFLNEQGATVGASAVSIDVANPPVTMRAYAANGSLLGADELSTGLDALTIHDVGAIGYVELTGEFWCVADFVRWNEVLEVEIDVRPGSHRNPVNPEAGGGVLPVAILTTPDFDAATVNPSSVAFEGAPEAHVDRRTGEALRHLADVDGDGDQDLLLHIRIGETSLDVSSVEGTLVGETLDGTPIYGADRVTVLRSGRLR